MPILAPVLTSADLQRFIAAHGIAAEILSLAQRTSTVSEAARVLGVGSVQIIKSLVFLRDDAPLLVITNGLARVDRRKLSVLLGVGRKHTHFASAEEALEITGYVVGSMPPFGHRQKLPTLVDPEVTTQDLVFGGGGDVDAMLRLTPAELLRVTAAQVDAVAE
jgi:prolyl-tRNA editing enzyme YbaK/EbsC (Cys-tRNA(Pro) deacylase)